MNDNDIVLEVGSQGIKFQYEDGLSRQNIKHIAEQQEASANTATNATHVYQVIVQLAKQIG